MQAYETAAARAIERCRTLAACTEVPGETTRLYLCEAMREVHGHLRRWMEAAGLAVRMDAAGNLRGRTTTHAEGAPVLLLGSHLDTVPNAGAFDGVLGVVLALAAVECLGPERLPFAVEILGFAEEEGVRFGRPFLGSLAVVGALDDSLLDLRDRDGVSVREALAGFGADVGSLPAAQLTAAERRLGFVEVHIEQGPVLESLDQPLGVVRAIAGQTRSRLHFQGNANHAGTTPMQLRHDAVAAAAAWVVAVEALALAIPGLVATVGRLEVSPGAPNVIAGEVVASLDVRHEDDATRRQAAERLFARAAKEGQRRGVAVRHETTLEQPAISMDRALVQRLVEAAGRAGYGEPPVLVSGAGHDAMVLAACLPSAMLFVRSPGGISHNPAETVLMPDVSAAIHTLVEFLRGLSDDEAIEDDADHA